MSVILKYPLILGGETALNVPLNSKIINVDFQHDELQAWILQPDNYQAKETLTLLAYTTGISFYSDNLSYIKTCMTSDDCFVCHVFTKEQNQ